VEEVWVFWEQVMLQPSLVWTVAFFMSAAAGWILHSINEDALQTFVIMTILFVAILIANAGFSQLGVYFSNDKESNIVAAAGASICAVAAMAVIIMRLMYAVGDLRRWIKNPSNGSA
jgi:F0F1-type ATP synthase membrane subunit a